MGQMSFQSSPQHDKWAIRVYNGYATYRPLIAIITYADIPRERHNTGIRGIDFSHKLVRCWKNLPIDWSIRAGYIHHFEKGYQPNHNQYTLFFLGHYRKSVFGFPVNFFIGEGLSWAELVPFVEGRETRRISGKDSQLMNYLNVGFDLKISDLFPIISYNNLSVGFSVSHRSGIYKQFKLFNNTQGGGNFVTFFTEFNF